MRVLTMWLTVDFLASSLGIVHIIKGKSVQHRISNFIIVILMVVMSIKGPSVSCSEEAEALACRKALEFAVESGFAELIIQGDNVAVMKAVASTSGDLSLLGHVYEDIKCNIHGLQHADISCIRRGGGNQVTRILAKYARNVDNELYWIGDSPPLDRKSVV